jgi:heme exporter protein A
MLESLKSDNLVDNKNTPKIMQSPLMIRTRMLTKAFGHFQVLRGIDLELHQGEFLTLLGPNGAGKTTLLRILATLAKPTSGEIELAGIPLTHAKASIRSIIGVISHQTFLYEDLTPLENLRFYGKMYDVPNLEQRIGEILEVVGLARRSNDRVRTFSRGMQQRLSIARAILPNPPILLLDEPDTGLDRHAADMLTQAIRDFGNTSSQRTVIMTTHNLERGLAMSDRIAILTNGRLAQQVVSADLSAEALAQLYYSTVDAANRNRKV